MKFSRRYVKKALEGSRPEISINQAWRMRMNGYIPSCNVAIFDCRDITLCAVPECCDIMYLNDVMSRVNPDYDGRIKKRQCWCVEGCAGSASMAMVQLLMSRSRSGGLRGRWKKNRNGKVLEGAEIGDYDWFIGGKDGGSWSSFRERVRVLIAQIRCVVEEENRVVTVLEEKRHPYANSGGELLIQDIRISGISLKVSFVQALHCKDMTEVVDGFDMNVVKVIYNPGSRKLYCSLDTVVAIESGLARVRDFEVSPGSPTTLEVARVSSTMKRMKKYGGRGYIFERYPKFRRAKGGSVL